MDRRRLTNRRAGFNLVAMSVILVVASIIMVGFLQGKEAGDVIQKSATTARS